MPDHVPQVGAPDPELKNSPIFGEAEELSLDLELEAGACYFNNVAYTSKPTSRIRTTSLWPKPWVSSVALR